MKLRASVGTRPPLLISELRSHPLILLLVHSFRYPVLIHNGTPCLSISKIDIGTPCLCMLALRAHRYWHSVIIHFLTPRLSTSERHVHPYWYSLLTHVGTVLINNGYTCLSYWRSVHFDIGTPSSSIFVLHAYPYLTPCSSILVLRTP